MGDYPYDADKELTSDNLLMKFDLDFDAEAYDEGDEASYLRADGSTYTSKSHWEQSED